MFSITSLNLPTGYQASIFGGHAGSYAGSIPVGTRMGPEGSVYFVAVNGLGTFFLEDVGQQPTGWGVRVNGGQNIWTYPGEGAAVISVSQDGGVQITGGTGPVADHLITNMGDCGVLTQRIITVVQDAPNIAAAWNGGNAMEVLFSIGLPRTCMINMQPNCCQQYAAIMQAINFSQPGLKLGDGQLGGWFGCALCKAFYTAMFAALFVMFIAIISSTGGGAAAIAALEEEEGVVAIARITGISIGRVIQLALQAFAAGGVASFLGDFVELICHEGGYCS